MRYLALLLLSAFGQVVTPLENETLQVYKTRVFAHWASTTDKHHKTVPREIIAAQPTVTSDNTAWADRANQALTDYLPLFQFAVNAIDTDSDQDRVTVSFNPIRNGSHGVIQLRATASKPEVAADFLDLLPDSIRDEEAKAITEQLDDLGDLTFTASYGYQRTAKNKSWRDVGWLWGRNYAIYEDLVNELQTGILPPESQQARNEASQALLQAENPLIAIHGTIHNKTMSALRVMFPINARNFADYLTLIDRLAQTEAAHVRNMATTRLDRLPALINNQPQLNISFSYRKRDGFSGQSGLTAGLTYEHGLHNLNRVARKHQSGTDLASAFNEVAGNTHEDRFTFSISYKQLNALSLTHEYTASDTPGSETVGLNLETYQEWQGGLAWSRNLSWVFQIGDFEISPKIGLGLAYTDRSDNPLLRDRLLGSLDLVLPVSPGVSFPLTLVYANHGRYRGEVDKELNVHLGLNYKFDRK